MAADRLPLAAGSTAGGPHAGSGRRACVGCRDSPGCFLPGGRKRRGCRRGCCTAPRRPLVGCTTGHSQASCTAEQVGGVGSPRSGSRYFEGESGLEGGGSGRAGGMGRLDAWCVSGDALFETGGGDGGAGRGVFGGRVGLCASGEGPRQGEDMGSGVRECRGGARGGTGWRHSDIPLWIWDRSGHVCGAEAGFQIGSKGGVLLVQLLHLWECKCLVLFLVCLIGCMLLCVCRMQLRLLFWLRPWSWVELRPGAIGSEGV